jgi:hypothetical protein
MPKIALIAVPPGIINLSVYPNPFMKRQCRQLVFAEYGSYAFKDGIVRRNLFFGRRASGVIFAIS